MVDTSAPRLSGRRTPPGPGISPMLRRLAAESATGVLLREHRTLYLSDGQVTHAESPETPGLDVLLTTGGVLDSEAWQEAVARAGARRRVGRFLVESGRVAEGALELCHMAAVFDAAYFLLGPSSAPARFRYGATHWLGPVRPVPVAALERESLRRRALLHGIWPAPATDTAPLVRAGPAEPPVPPRQEAVLDQVNGFRTAADIALALGRPAFHTLVDLRRLAAAGIVTTASPSLHGRQVLHGRHPLQRTESLPSPQALSAAAPAAVDGTYETPGTGTTSEPPSSAPGPPDPGPVATLLAQPSADPDVALLRRLRDALEAL